MLDNVSLICYNDNRATTCRSKQAVISACKYLFCKIKKETEDYYEDFRFGNGDNGYYLGE